MMRRATEQPHRKGEVVGESNASCRAKAGALDKEDW